jgi:hydroxymethylglutaryl-CoA reductase
VSGFGSSRIPGFYELGRSQRLSVLRAAVGPSSGEEGLDAIASTGDWEVLDTFIENAVGAFPLPLGIAVNFVVDGRDLLVPMAIEESSVVAAASYMARLARPTGGFRTEVVEDLAIGQVQLVDVPDLDGAVRLLRERSAEIVARAEVGDPGLARYGGGCRGVEIRPFTAEQTGGAPAIVVHLLVDCADSMGANAVDTMCEAVAPVLAGWLDARVGLRIVSNLADRRRFRASCVLRADDMALPGFPGPDVVRGIAAASDFAGYDPYRAATHNKGIMNGVDAVVLATGNDWRAVEAGAHAWAARSGAYRPLSSWTVGDDGDLHGQLEMPLQVGTVGGVTRLHPAARFALRLMGISSGSELARVIAAVGLAQNLGALRALATEGIQKGHMRLHERNASLAGVDGAGSDER